MTSVHRITVQKESKYLFFITESLSVSDIRREEKSQMETLEAEKTASGLGKPDFSQKEASIWPKRRKHLLKMSLCFGNISYCFPQYLLLLFQIRSERNTPSSGWQPQAELSEVTKKSECNPIRSTFTTDTTFSFPCAYHQSRTPRYMSSGKTCRTRFFHPGKHPVRNKRF